MKDMQAHLEKLRAQIAECEMIRDLAPDLRKRELFARLQIRLLRLKSSALWVAIPNPRKIAYARHQRLLAFIKSNIVSGISSYST